LGCKSVRGGVAAWTMIRAAFPQHQVLLDDLTAVGVAPAYTIGRVVCGRRVADWPKGYCGLSHDTRSSVDYSIRVILIEPSENEWYGVARD
jgi:hypothetical protein